MHFPFILIFITAPHFIQDILATGMGDLLLPVVVPPVTTGEGWNVNKTHTGLL